MSIDWKQTIASGELIIGTMAEAQAKSVFPNRLGWVAERKDVGALIAFQSNGEDVAVSKGGIDYLASAITAGRIKEAFVLLLRRTDNGNGLELIKAMPVAELTNVSWRAGRWGQFAWISGATCDAPF